MTYIPVDVFIECVQTSGIKSKYEYYELHRRGIVPTDLMPLHPAMEYNNTYHKQHRQKPEVKKRQQVYQQTPKVKAYRKSPEYKAKLKAYQKACRESPEAKAYQKAYQQSPKWKAYHKAYRESPEQIAYHKAYYQRNKKT